MRINQYIARETGMSRRQVDTAIRKRRVTVNDETAELGMQIESGDTVRVDGTEVYPQTVYTIMLNKPTGYIVSRARQGNNPTIYTLLPETLYHMKPIGRLDKDSRGLLLLSNDGDLIQTLTHPKHQKTKVYYVTLDQSLSNSDRNAIREGVELDDGVSRIEITEVNDDSAEAYNLQPHTYRAIMREGRNRQIRRTFAALGYEVTDLLRLQLGDYTLGNLTEGEYREEV